MTAVPVPAACCRGTVLFEHKKSLLPEKGRDIIPAVPPCFLPFYPRQTLPVCNVHHTVYPTHLHKLIFSDIQLTWEIRSSSEPGKISSPIDLPSLLEDVSLLTRSKPFFICYSIYFNTRTRDVKENPLGSEHFVSQQFVDLPSQQNTVHTEIKPEHNQYDRCQTSIHI